MDYYCIASCDKCRKSRKILSEKNIAHREIDMRKDGVPEAKISQWISAYGLDAILNRKSTSWRQLDDHLKDKIEETPAAVIDTNPAMLKRPILDFGDHILTAKDAIHWLEKA